MEIVKIAKKSLKIPSRFRSEARNDVFSIENRLKSDLQIIRSVNSI
jgi:hypothetical protein